MKMTDFDFDILTLIFVCTIDNQSYGHLRNRVLALGNALYVTKVKVNVTWVKGFVQKKQG